MSVAEASGVPSAEPLLAVGPEDEDSGEEDVVVGTWIQPRGVEDTEARVAVEEAETLPLHCRR